MPKTRITGSFRRSEKTARDFFITVENGFDEEVTYKDESELEARRVELRDRAIQTIIDDINVFKQTLGVEEKRVFVAQPAVAEPADLKKIGLNLD